MPSGAARRIAARPRLLRELCQARHLRAAEVAAAVSISVCPTPTVLHQHPVANERMNMRGLRPNRSTHAVIALKAEEATAPEVKLPP